MDAEHTLGRIQGDRYSRLLRIGLIVFVLAFAIRAAVMALTPAPPLHGDMVTYEGIAVNLVEGKWHFGWGEEPSAHREPIYPLFLAAIYKVFGHSHAAVHWVQALVGAGTCVLAVVLASYVVKSVAAPLLCGLMAAVYPPFVLQPQTILSESLGTFLLLLAMTVVVRGWSQERRSLVIWGGFFLGLATLTRAASLLYVPMLAVVSIAFKWGRRTIGIRGTVAMCAVFLGVLFPWTVRNYVVFDRFIPVGVNGGIVLFYGNYDGPKPDPAVEALVKDMDEVGRDRFLMRRGIQLIRDDPVRFAVGCLRKLPQYWLNIGYDQPPSRASVAFAFGNGILLAFSFWGIFRSGLIEHRSAGPIYLLLAYFTLLHVVLVARGRYSVPLMPYMLAFSAAGLLAAARRLTPNRIPASWFEVSSTRTSAQ
jgi:4-amino-4-deoxy-L-arabinose transferase-like glycosyltransferase